MAWLAHRLKSSIPHLQKALRSESLSFQRPSSLHRTLLCPTLTNPEVSRDYSTASWAMEKNIKVPLALFGGAGNSASALYHTAVKANALEKPIGHGKKVILEQKIGPKISKNRNLRDHKCRLLAAKYELRRKLYKALCQDPNLPSHVRDKHRYKLSKLPRNSSFARVRNRCIFTGRPRAVYEKFRMSRIVFRALASQGALMGIKKSSW